MIISCLLIANHITSFSFAQLITLSPVSSIKKAEAA
jgi:hypothetical protein